MRVTVLTVGSRGDVTPFLALGVGLVRAGHAVRLATHAEFAHLVADAGLEFAELPGDPRSALASPEGQAMLTTRNPAALPRRILAPVGPGVRNAAEPAERACAGADVVVAATLALMGPTAAQTAGARLVWAHLQPNDPTRGFAFPSAPRELPGPLNRLSWTAAQALFWRGVRPVLQERRRVLGLVPLPEAPPARWGLPTLYGFSPAVVPPPADWPPTAHVTGYWTAPAPEWTPPAPLTAFLDAGAPPVYLGFGSMPDADPAAATGMLLGGLRRAGRRGVLLSGWSGLAPSDSTDDVLVVGEVPHAWLFPRVAAVLHHGGAGTTAAGLLAGAPTVVVPFFADQFFWGRRVAALGAGPRPVPRERLTAERVAAALSAAVDDPRFGRAARRLAERLRAEDGVAAAVRVLEQLTR